MVVYGHSHQPKIEKNGVLYFNPGSAGQRFPCRERGEADDRSGVRQSWWSWNRASKRKASRKPAFLLPTFRGQDARATHYFFGAIASFAAFATRNFTTVFALI